MEMGTRQVIEIDPTDTKVRNLCAALGVRYLPVFTRMTEVLNASADVSGASTGEDHTALRRAA